MSGDQLDCNLSRERLVQVADSTPLLLALFQNLQNQANAYGDDMVVVATWTKRQSGNNRSFPIPDTHTLDFVLRGYLRGNNENLQFWAQPKEHAAGLIPRDGRSFREVSQDLFV